MASFGHISMPPPTARLSGAPAGGVGYRLPSTWPTAPAGAVPPTSASLDLLPPSVQRAPSMTSQVPALVVPEGGDLETSLEASRARVAGLRRALGREEELIRHQANEARRLENLQRGLEEEANAAVRRRTLEAAARVARAAAAGVEESRQNALPSHSPAQSAKFGQAPGPGSAASIGAAEPHAGAGVGAATSPAWETANCSFEGPMSLEDVKQHLLTITRLRRRVVELEGDLDSKEEQVAALSEELHRRRAAALAAAAG